jgi:hypothetical protein
LATPEKEAVDVTDLAEPARKRKVLSLELDPQERNGQPRYVAKADAVFMVWRDGGFMPSRVYRAGEKSIAESHAKTLCEQTGERFYVLRAWRGFDPL